MAIALVAICLLAVPQQPEPQGSGGRHWAYLAPVCPTPPTADGSPIDAFVNARIAAAGLEPTSPADRATLIRRVSLDLIGLPPTLAEVDAFVADARPDAYERLVDRLLASPHYGERWALKWLDLARYADTGGHNFDRPRTMWPWRDYVVDAFNRDLPFDRFTLEQLAGDLLDDADQRTRIATGFHRNTMLNDEGGVDPAEARWERLLDRASTTATVWLGSTMHCAQCHDHKYDPISQREFYGMVAFFEAQDEIELDLADAAQRERRDELQRGIAAAKARGDKAAQNRLQKELRALALPSTLALREKQGAATETRLRIRGSYDQPADTVAAHTPAALHGWPAGAPRNRLGLAQWLVSPQNPLTARVAVNRLWDTLMGRPLVDTPEDFGRQAPPPLHQDLLDWLAAEYVRLGWRQKPLLRAIVLSDTYRRSAAAPPAAWQQDPQNRLLARGTRFRLEAELIRDLMLSASGLLDPQLGGAPVFPLQADTSGVVAVNKVDMAWRPSRGGDAHRRGLYTYWRRTAPFVAFALFDAPSREQCTVRRQATNTPLQALSGLNDPAAWEAAVALGKRMADAPGPLRTQLAFGFRLCTSRQPTDVELDLLERAWAAEPPERAFALLGNVLLNLDETLSRG